MFDLEAKPRVWIPVYWPGLAPGESEDDVARVVTHRIDTKVEIVDREALEDTFGIQADRPADAPQPSPFDIFKRLVSDWRKIVANGQPVPFTDDHINRLLAMPNFQEAFQAAYLKAYAGQVEIREGNSESSSSGGRAAGSAPKASRANSKRIAKGLA